MFANFLNLVLESWNMVISVLENTELGGFSYMSVLVAVIVLTLIVRVVFVMMK